MQPQPHDRAARCPAEPFPQYLGIRPELASQLGPPESIQAVMRQAAFVRRQFLEDQPDDFPVGDVFDQRRPGCREVDAGAKRNLPGVLPAATAGILPSHAVADFIPGHLRQQRGQLRRKTQFIPTGEKTDEEPPQDRLADVDAVEILSQPRVRQAETNVPPQLRLIAVDKVRRRMLVSRPSTVKQRSKIAIRSKICTSMRPYLSCLNKGQNYRWSPR